MSLFSCCSCYTSCLQLTLPLAYSLLLACLLLLPTPLNLTQSDVDLSTGSFPACDILNYYLLLMYSKLLKESKTIRSRPHPRLNVGERTLPVCSI
ncbi:hypothetical protein L873DRAFT_1811370 [Choiromyces venosus 120613-1]|uniref:Uncharacterized protein n=1 Tax=Choiromyces venosus 120613-1 TaxID=1336337 RepID=A0A3N4JIG7_9PEZI|nr:hypothetical protein L873DRAFT_1811370 [Choiromyces venosus 120613-1]